MDIRLSKPRRPDLLVVLIGSGEVLGEVVLFACLSSLRFTVESSTTSKYGGASPLGSGWLLERVLLRVLERISEPVSGVPVSRLRRIGSSGAGVWRFCIDRSPSTVSSSLCSKGMSWGDVGISEYLDALECSRD